MDDQDQITGAEDKPAHSTPGSTAGEGVPVPSRIREAVNDVRRRIREEASRERDVVQEYEERYHGRDSSRLEALPAEEGMGRARMPAKSKRWHDPSTVSGNERKWAMLAHASTLVTALVALPTAGMAFLLTMFAPLLIYFAFRKRSEFVAFHALQAFTVQLVGIVGWLAIVTIGTLIAAALFLISVPLIIVFLLGLLLMAVVAIVWVLLMVASLALPVGMVIYSVIAVVETRQGHNYRIPYIARWVEGQMYSGGSITVH